MCPQRFAIAPRLSSPFPSARISLSSSRTVLAHFQHVRPLQLIVLLSHAHVLGSDARVRAEG
eukprot:3233900-Rhodomonas_salina.1